MDDSKSFLRHEELNIITLLNFLIADSDLDADKRGDILKQLKMLALLIGQEKLFLGERRDFFIREFDLMDVLDMLPLLLEEEIRRTGLELELPVFAGKVEADFDVLKNGLEQLILSLASGTKKIEISYDDASHRLLIQFDGECSIKKEKGPLIELLNKGLDHAIINLQVNLHLMEMSGLKLSFDPGCVIIQL